MIVISREQIRRKTLCRLKVTSSERLAKKSAPRHSWAVCYALHPVFRVCFSSSLFSITALLFILPPSSSASALNQRSLCEALWLAVLGGGVHNRLCHAALRLTASMCRTLFFYTAARPAQICNPSALRPAHSVCYFSMVFSSSFPLLHSSLSAPPSIQFWPNHPFHSPLSLCVFLSNQFFP